MVNSENQLKIKDTEYDTSWYNTVYLFTEKMTDSH